MVDVVDVVVVDVVDVVDVPDAVVVVDVPDIFDVVFVVVFEFELFPDKVCVLLFLSGVSSLVLFALSLLLLLLFGELLSEDVSFPF